MAARRLQTLLLLAVPVLAGTATATPDPSIQGHERVVRGVNGDPDLVLDRGRDLSSHPLRAERGRKTPVWLSPIENVRLDARRLAFASKLSPVEVLDRFLHIVRGRFPCSGPGCTCAARYDKINRTQVSRWGKARLSHHVREKTGMCREKAFLLSEMLREADIRGRVRYGLAYDPRGQLPAGPDGQPLQHAWVEARAAHRTWLLDPATCPVALPLRRAAVPQAQPSGQLRQARAALTSAGIYVPLQDP